MAKLYKTDSIVLHDESQKTLKSTNTPHRNSHRHAQRTSLHYTMFTPQTYGG